MALSDFYDFAPLLAQMQGGGMSGGMGVPQNMWQGGQFVMPPVAPPAMPQQLAPYKGTAMQMMGQPRQAATSLLGALVGPSRAGRPGGRRPGNWDLGQEQPFGGIYRQGLMG